MIHLNKTFLVFLGERRNCGVFLLFSPVSASCSSGQMPFLFLAGLLVCGSLGVFLFPEDVSASCASDGMLFFFLAGVLLCGSQETILFLEDGLRAWSVIGPGLMVTGSVWVPWLLVSGLMPW